MIYLEKLSESPEETKIETREKLVDEYHKLKSDFERDLDIKAEKIRELNEQTVASIEEESENAFNLDTLVKYLNDNKTVLEENMNDDDRERMQSVLNISKDIKSLCKEAIDTLKIDLMAFYNLGKSKFTNAIEELGKITSLNSETK